MLEEIGLVSVEVLQVRTGEGGCSNCFIKNSTFMGEEVTLKMPLHGYDIHLEMPPALL